MRSVCARRGCGAWCKGAQVGACPPLPLACALAPVERLKWSSIFAVTALPPTMLMIEIPVATAPSVCAVVPAGREGRVAGGGVGRLEERSSRQRCSSSSSRHQCRRRRLRTGQQPAAHEVHAAQRGHSADRVGGRHQRRVQRGRDAPDDLVADRGRERENRRHVGEGRVGRDGAKGEHRRAAPAGVDRSGAIRGLRRRRRRGRRGLRGRGGLGRRGGRGRRRRRPGELAAVDDEHPAHRRVRTVDQPLACAGFWCFLFLWILEFCRVVMGLGRAGVGCELAPSRGGVAARNSAWERLTARHGCAPRALSAHPWSWWSWARRRARTSAGCARRASRRPRRRAS